ncbi:unnamed protein product [Diabrotica balteata]|uniref:Glucose-methanol-choline oxidoreductase N-terminal domain-containing protein n=1 Tax=Diabrotica balteata TaxID=107213 RepID=A0A9N9STG5_DIABA|nr:unnamed protein product [Diabrotica balteata]
MILFKSVPLAVFTLTLFSSKDFCATASDNVFDEVKYYEKLITDELQKALNYETPTNARMYEPDDTTIRDFGTFDFVIIGAGSTGSVIASRLSEISRWKILLLEAGHYPNNFTMIPGMFAIQAMTSYNWGFKSTPQKTACLGAVDNRCVIPRGKGVGGTSLINQNIYSRGNSIDYDRWAELVNDQSWRYENVLNYFKKSEDFHQNNPQAPVDWDYHGKKGYLYTNFHLPPSNFTEVFLKANRELGLNITDYNGKEQIGATIMQINTKKGRRYDQASAFITPVRERSNLIISEGSYVVKLETKHKKVKSVLFTKNKKLFRVKITREVILSAGAISSPQILMLSGIGPKKHLNGMEIPIVQDLPVGNNLRDHIFCGLQFSSNVSSVNQTLTQKIKEFLHGYGDLTAGNPLDAAGWYRTALENTFNYPDIEVIPSISGSGEIGKKFLQWKDEIWNTIFNISIPNPFTLSAVLLHSKSVGTVRLQTKNPYYYPAIDYNSLSDRHDADLKTLYEGIQLILNISKTLAFQKMGTKLEVRPLSACEATDFLSRHYWYCFIRQMSIPAFHPVGTCRTGTDPKVAVVDWNLNVFGMRRLRVADASVLPFTFSGHPNAICTMIGEKLSDVIKFEYKKDFAP